MQLNGMYFEAYVIGVKRYTRTFKVWCQVDRDVEYYSVIWKRTLWSV